MPNYERAQKNFQEERGKKFWIRNNRERASGLWVSKDQCKPCAWNKNGARQEAEVRGSAGTEDQSSSVFLRLWARAPQQGWTWTLAPPRSPPLPWDPAHRAPPAPACSKGLDRTGSTCGLAVSLDWMGRSRVIAGPPEPDPPRAGAEELMPAGRRITPNKQNSTCLDTGSRSSRNHPTATEGL